MSTSSDVDWVTLLHVAKAIRRSVRPVAPSPGFRRHLKSDLATALEPAPAPSPVVIERRRSSAPVAITLGFLVGAAVTALTLMALRQAPPSDHFDV